MFAQDLNESDPFKMTSNRYLKKKKSFKKLTLNQRTPHIIIIIDITHHTLSICSVVDV